MERYQYTLFPARAILHCPSEGYSGPFSVSTLLRGNFSAGPLTWNKFKAQPVKIVVLMLRTFLFCCPVTGLNVQGSVTAEPSADGSTQYEAMECLACRQRHFVNVATLKLLSDEQDE
jgi:hypothetical protein